MPELPDITVYVERIAERVLGATLLGARVASPFVVRTVTPPLSSLVGHKVLSVSRLGKRVIIGFDGSLFLVVHLMVAGRFRFRDAAEGKGSVCPIPGRIGLAAFDFTTGTLLLTEASTKRRASIHVSSELEPFDRGGLEPLTATVTTFRAALSRQRHTLKRALTDPTIVSGIGNAYSDEILHAAQLSPFRMSDKLNDDEWGRFHQATIVTLTRWTDELRREPGFPTRVTAFREGMAVHGRAKQPCPVCAAPIQRIVHAENESNYCAKCQTQGRILMDRSLSKLLRDDWPRTLEELEERTAANEKRRAHASPALEASPGSAREPASRKAASSRPTRRTRPRP